MIYTSVKLSTITKWKKNFLSHITAAQKTVLYLVSSVFATFFLVKNKNSHNYNKKTGSTYPLNKIY